MLLIGGLELSFLIVSFVEIRVWDVLFDMMGLVFLVSFLRSVLCVLVFVVKLVIVLVCDLVFIDLLVVSFVRMVFFVVFECSVNEWMVFV